LLGYDRYDGGADRGTRFHISRKLETRLLSSRKIVLDEMVKSKYNSVSKVRKAAGIFDTVVFPVSPRLLSISDTQGL
tara:strand:+ start:1410 stop:1640 length:231 start_codon:yes stop_codon:yes gene_type:complete